ncbi:uncharacterized protein si:ch73-344o19.1 [Trichomycterus rosablanca]|uniref:uncharacterized protein si:ch73-344o19.1 n=1 Tax=Trichomycterus rosablanca TaxID=2290929 RepID=UPI002F3506F7
MDAGLMRMNNGSCDGVDDVHCNTAHLHTLSARPSEAGKGVPTTSLPTLSPHVSPNKINSINLLVTPENFNTKQPSTHLPAPAQIRGPNMDTDSAKGMSADSLPSSSLPSTELTSLDSEMNQKISNLNKTNIDTTGAGILYTAVPGHHTEASTKTQDPSSSRIPLRSTTVTAGSLISSPLSTTASSNLNEEHQSSTQSVIITSEVIPSVVPPVLLSSPASTVKVLISGSASLENSHQVGASELDVGDEDSKVPSASPWDPLLAGLISMFIISTALLSTMLFIRFRQQNNHPEFHRLHDLPMDDLLEDTPLSRYAY